MNLHLAFSLFLNMTPEHNHNAALYLYRLAPAMFINDLHLPAEISNAVRETYQETLCRLGHDLDGIDSQELTALDAYCLYLPVEGEQSLWGLWPRSSLH